MGARTSRTQTTNRVVEEFSADDESGALTSETMLLLWNYHFACPVDPPSPEITRLLPIYNRVLQKFFDHLLQLKEGSLLFLVAKDPSMAVEPGLIIHKNQDHIQTQALHLRERNAMIFQQLQSKHPGYNRYLAVQVQSP